MDRKTLTALFFIASLAAALRFSYLTFNPPSLNWDEVSHGYNAYSILKTGRDEWGKPFPITNFRAYGDYPLPVNLYLAIPFIATFGLNEFSIRLPHAILGVLTALATYFLCIGLTKKRNISLLAALLVAIEPWALFTSRFVLQSNLSVFLVTASLAFFLNREKRKYFLPVSLIFLFLSLFSYHTARIFSPLILLAMIAIYPKEFQKESLLILVTLFFATSVFILRNPEAKTRGGLLFLIDQSAVNKIVELRNASSLPGFAKRIVYNRPVYFMTRFSKNYISYFSPQFLFLKGGTQYQFSVPHYGLLFLLNLPFFYLGVILVAKNAFYGKKEYLLIFVWLLLSPIPASITNESFAVVRATTMLPLPQILSATGFYFILEKFFKRAMIATTLLYGIVVLFSLENYLAIYFTKYRRDYSWSWQYGYKEAVDYARANYGKYDKIIVTKKYGEPHEFFLFFWPWDPAKYQSDSNLIRFNQSNWYWVDGFDKFYFVNDWQVPKKVSSIWYLESGKEFSCQETRCLLITSPGNYPKDWKKLETINFLDGEPAFEILDNGVL